MQDLINIRGTSETNGVGREKARKAVLKHGIINFPRDDLFYFAF